MVRMSPAEDSADGDKDNSSQVGPALRWCSPPPHTCLPGEMLPLFRSSKSPTMNHCSKIPQDLKHQKHTKKRITHSGEPVTLSATGLIGYMTSLGYSALSAGLAVLIHACT